MMVVLVWNFFFNYSVFVARCACSTNKPNDRPLKSPLMLKCNFHLGTGYYLHFLLASCQRAHFLFAVVSHGAMVRASIKLSGSPGYS